MNHLRYDVYDYIRELTRPHVHRETYAIRRGDTTWTRRHSVRSPALIIQLYEAAPASSGERIIGGARSMPNAYLEALDTAAHIDREASYWVRRFGLHDPVDRIDARGITVRGSGTVACIRLVGGIHRGLNPSDDKAVIHEIETDVRIWWNQARIISGWDSPAWRPDNTCSQCGKRGGLRIRLALGSALCIECRAIWDNRNIGLLAEHIRAENRENR